MKRLLIAAITAFATLSAERGEAERFSITGQSEEQANAFTTPSETQNSVVQQSQAAVDLRSVAAHAKRSASHFGRLPKPASVRTVSAAELTSQREATLDSQSATESATSSELAGAAAYQAQTAPVLGSAQQTAANAPRLSTSREVPLSALTPTMIEAPEPVDSKTMRVTKRRILPYLLGGAGAAAVGAGSVFARPSSKYSRAGEGCTHQRCTKSALDSARSRERDAALAAVGMGMGVTALGLAGYLFLEGSGKKKTSRPLRVIPSIGQNGGAFKLETRF